jgi:TatA/E family protein of Tat protein translocase
VLLIVVLIFGTKKLKNIGSDLGAPSRASRTACATAVQRRDRPPRSRSRPTQWRPNAEHRRRSKTHDQG